MAESREDFWPSEIPDPGDPAPVALLKEQAELLAVKTSGEIEGVVRMYIEDGTAYHTLFLKPIPLGDYLYKLLSISYPVFRHSSDIYPISAENSGEGRAYTGGVSLANEEEFRDWLRSQLSSEYVRSTLGTLKNYIRHARSVRAS
jgi:hypothetical protein